MEIEKEKLAFVLVFILGIGFSIGISWQQNGMTHFVTEYIFGDTSCGERALILSYWLPFELDADLQVKDCQHVRWLDQKFQEQHFKEGD